VYNVKNPYKPVLNHFFSTGRGGGCHLSLINNNKNMENRLIPTFYALLARGEGPGMKKNGDRREYTQFL
jgi:hypothetical protein